MTMQGAAELQYAGGVNKHGMVYVELDVPGHGERGLAALAAVRDAVREWADHVLVELHSTHDPALIVLRGPDGEVLGAAHAIAPLLSQRGS